MTRGTEEERILWRVRGDLCRVSHTRVEEGNVKGDRHLGERARPGHRDTQATARQRPGGAGRQSANREETGDRLARCAGAPPKLRMPGHRRSSSFQPMGQ